VTRPLGLPRMLGIPPDDQGDIADNVSCGEPMTPDELEAAIGIRAMPESEVTPESVLLLNRPELRAAGLPGGGGVATAATMALFYQALLHNPGELWDPAVLADATGR